MQQGDGVGAEAQRRQSAQALAIQELVDPNSGT
jgi:hypothetical protein